MRQDRCCHCAKTKAYRAFKRTQADHHSKRGDQRPGSKCENEGFRCGMDRGDPGALGGEETKIFLFQRNYTVKNDKEGCICMSHYSRRMLD